MAHLEPLLEDLRSLYEAEGDGGAPIGTKSKRKTGIWQKVKHGVWKLVKKPDKGPAPQQKAKKPSSKKVKGTPPPKPVQLPAKYAKQYPNYKSPKPNKPPHIGELAPILPGKEWKKYKHEPQSTEEKYKRHGQWTPERKALHREIFQHFLSTTKPVPKDKTPVAIMMMGGPATGKGQLTKGISNKKFVKVDADNIKEMLPEYQDLVSKGDANAANYVHKESGELASRLRDIARKQRKNMVLDGTGRYAGSYMHRMGQLQDAGYHVQLLMPVVSDVEDAVARAKKRGAESGRHVPEKFIRDNHKTVMRNFSQLSKLADSAFLFNNDGAKPEIAWARQGDTEHTMDPEFADEFFRRYGGSRKRRRKPEEAHYFLARDLSTLISEGPAAKKPAEDPESTVQDMLKKLEPSPNQDDRFGDDEGIIVPEPDDSAI
jgi:predicted ABC-type ATPase